MAYLEHERSDTETDEDDQPPYGHREHVSQPLFHSFQCLVGLVSPQHHVPVQAGARSRRSQLRPQCRAAGRPSSRNRPAGGSQECRVREPSRGAARQPLFVVVCAHSSDCWLRCGAGNGRSPQCSTGAPKPSVNTAVRGREWKSAGKHRLIRPRFVRSFVRLLRYTSFSRSRSCTTMSSRPRRSSAASASNGSGSGSGKEAAAVASPKRGAAAKAKQQQQAIATSPAKASPAATRGGKRGRGAVRSLAAQFTFGSDSSSAEKGKAKPAAKRGRKPSAAASKRKRRHDDDSSDDDSDDDSDASSDSDGSDEEAEDSDEDSATPSKRGARNSLPGFSLFGMYDGAMSRCSMSMSLTHSTSQSIWARLAPRLLRSSISGCNDASPRPRQDASSSISCSEYVSLTLARHWDGVTHCWRAFRSLRSI